MGYGTAAPRYNAAPRDRQNGQNVLVITGVRYNGVPLYTEKNTLG